MQQTIRMVNDRRKIHRPFCFHAIRGRRQGFRRDGEVVFSHNRQDIYSPEIFFLTVSLLILCALDAHHTLILLQAGFVELNPLMLHMINQGIWQFVLVKESLTGMGILLLVAYHNFQLGSFIRVIHLIYLIFSIYLILIVYQLLMMPKGTFAIG